MDPQLQNAKVTRFLIVSFRRSKNPFSAGMVKVTRSDLQIISLPNPRNGNELGIPKEEASLDLVKEGNLRLNHQTQYQFLARPPKSPKMEITAYKASTTRFGWTFDGRRVILQMKGPTSPITLKVTLPARSHTASLSESGTLLRIINSSNAVVCYTTAEGFLEYFFLNAFHINVLASSLKTCDLDADIHSLGCCLTLQHQSAFRHSEFHSRSGIYTIFQPCTKDPYQRDLRVQFTGITFKGTVGNIIKGSLEISLGEPTAEPSPQPSQSRLVSGFFSEHVSKAFVAVQTQLSESQIQQINSQEPQILNQPWARKFLVLRYGYLSDKPADWKCLLLSGGVVRLDTMMIQHQWGHIQNIPYLMWFEAQPITHVNLIFFHRRTFMAPVKKTVPKRILGSEPVCNRQQIDLFGCLMVKNCSPITAREKTLKVFNLILTIQ